MVDITIAQPYRQAPKYVPDTSAQTRPVVAAVGRLSAAVSDIDRMEAERDFNRQATEAMLNWASAQEEYGIAENEARVSAEPGAAGHAQASRGRAQAASERVLSSIRSEELRDQYSVRIADWMSNRNIEADRFERLSTAKLMGDQMGAAADIMANEVRRRDAVGFAEMLRDIATMEAPHGMPGDAVNGWRREAAQKITYNWLDAQEPEKRRALLDSGLHDAVLSPEQMEALRNGADSDIRRKQIEADAAARAAKAVAVEQVDDVLDRINRGYPVTDDDYAAAMKVAQENGLDKRVRDLNDAFVGKQVNKEYAHATPAQIDARIKIIDADFQKQGDKAPPALVAERAALENLLTERTSQVKNDPLAAGAAMGITVEPVDWSDPKSVAKRRQAAEATGKALGVPPRYLTDEEADQLAANADTPSGQLAIGRQLQPLGPRAATLAARQVAPGDDLFAYAVGLPANIQQAIFRGKELRKQYPVPAKDAQQAWRDITGSAMARLPEASREAAYLSAVEIYRQAAARSGKDEFDVVLFRGAVREALGGTVNGRLGGIGEWNGAKIMLPSSMSQSSFDARLGNFNPTMARRADKSKIPAAEFRKNFTPVMQPNGKYRFVNARGEYVLFEDGRSPLELDITKVKPKVPTPEYVPGSTGAFWGAPPGSMKGVKPVVPKGPQPRASGV